MDPLQLREREIFETLKKLKKFRFVIIGGYAANAYTLPRFSVDCDIVIEDTDESRKIEGVLIKNGYAKVLSPKMREAYHSAFERYEKDLGNGFRVSIDILIAEVSDRQTMAVFPAEWIFSNSSIRTLKGRTITEALKARIVNIDALFVMKFISCRATDIRDIFMLVPNVVDKDWIMNEISSRYNFDAPFIKIEAKITSKQFRDGLQGVYGLLDGVAFEKHKNAVLGLRTRSS